MNIDDDLRPIFFEGVPAALEFLAYLAGALLAVLNRHKYPRPCYWLGFTCGYFILLHAAQIASFKYLIHYSVSMGDLTLFVFMAATRVAYIIGFSLLVVAVFSGRTHTKEEETFR